MEGSRSFEQMAQNEERKNEIIDMIDKVYFKNFLDKIDEFRENEENDMRDVEALLLIDMDMVGKYIDESLGTLAERVNDMIKEDDVKIEQNNSFEAVLRNSVVTGINGIMWTMENIYSDDIEVQKKLNDMNSGRMKMAELFQKAFEPENIPYYFDALCDDEEKLSAEISSSEGYLKKFEKYFFETENENDLFDRTYPRGGEKLPYFRFFSEMEKGNISAENIEEELDKLSEENIDKEKIKKDITGEGE